MKTLQSLSLTLMGMLLAFTLTIVCDTEGGQAQSNRHEEPILVKQTDGYLKLIYESNSKIRFEILKGSASQEIRALGSLEKLKNKAVLRIKNEDTGNSVALSFLRSDDGVLTVKMEAKEKAAVFAINLTKAAQVYTEPPTRAKSHEGGRAISLEESSLSVGYPQFKKFFTAQITAEPALRAFAQLIAAAESVSLPSEMRMFARTLNAFDSAQGSDRGVRLIKTSQLNQFAALCRELDYWFEEAFNYCAGDYFCQQATLQEYFFWSSLLTCGWLA